jgi:hypothetical protein
MPIVGVGEQGRAGCFSLLAVLIAPEETVVPAVDIRRPPFTAAVVRDDEACRGAETIAAHPKLHEVWSRGQVNEMSI